MSIASLKKTLGLTVECEIELLQKGQIDCANRLLRYRIYADDLMFAMECLIAEDDATYTDIINYMYSQIKEIVQMINTNT